MSNNRRVTPPNKEGKSGEEKRLNNVIKRLQRENDQLKAELKTLEVYFKKTQTFVKGYTEDLSAQELIKGAKDGKNIKKMKDAKLADHVCPKCGSEDYKTNILPFGVMKVCNGCKDVKVEKTKKD